MRLPNRKSATLCLALLSFSSIAAEPITVANFSQNDLASWEKQVFDGETKYELTTLNNGYVLKASSNGSASGLVKRIRIDLHRTPFINWEWRVENSLYRLNEDVKAGDDFAARVYVVIDGGIFFWRTLALNYVWASSKPSGAMWDNPFTSNAQMLAIESGDENAGQWLIEKRNVRQDLQKAFGRDFRFIDAVAIMTDTDNSGQQATAYYGDIYFTSQ